MLEAVAVSTKLVSWSTKQLSTNPNLSTVGSLASEQRSVCVHKFRLKAFEVTEIAGVQLFCRVSGRVPPFSPKPPTSLQCSLLNIHNRDVYVYRRIHLYIVNVYNVRLETSAVYSVLFTRRTPRFIIRSFTNAWVHPPPACCGVWSKPRGLEGSLEALRAAWTAVWGSAVLPCFCRLRHRALFTAVSPFLTLAPFFLC